MWVAELNEPDSAVKRGSGLKRASLTQLGLPLTIGKCPKTKPHVLPLIRTEQFDTKHCTSFRAHQDSIRLGVLRFKTDLAGHVERSSLTGFFSKRLAGYKLNFINAA